MRILIAALILLALSSFGAAFWMVFEGTQSDIGHVAEEPRHLPPAEPETERTAAAETAEPASPAPAPSSQAAAPTAPAPASAEPAPAQPAPAEPAPAQPAAADPAPPAGSDPLAALAARPSPSPLPLALPIDCDPGTDCWVINHVDLDPGPGRRDYRCGDMSYDGHKGTDIALRNLRRLDDNVPVLAAAPGKVVGTRDGMEDVSIAVTGPEAVKSRECGNGVRIQHDGGWATQYCHMKRGSIAVQTGQTVERGQRLGAVGLSGMTEFPHIHMTVEKDGKVIDPFRGVDGGPDCGRGNVPLWDAEARRALVDHAPVLLDAGFATGPVEKTDAEAGNAGVDRAGTEAAALVVWARAAGIEPGDTLATTITGPDGATLFSDRWTADRTRIVQFRYVGKKRPGGGWAAGTYTGRVVLERDGRKPREQTLSIRIGG